jgi:hypothetical protein
LGKSHPNSPNQKQNPLLISHLVTRESGCSEATWEKNKSCRLGKSKGGMMSEIALQRPRYGMLVEPLGLEISSKRVLNAIGYFIPATEGTLVFGNANVADPQEFH